MVSPEKERELRSSPDRSTSVEQQNTTPTSQNVIARVHQLLEVNIGHRNVNNFSPLFQYKLETNYGQQIYNSCIFRLQIGIGYSFSSHTWHSRFLKMN